MGAFKDTYDIIKDLLKAAKAVQNQEVVQLAMDLQEKFFELREDNEELIQKIKSLEAQISDLKQVKVTEDDMEFSSGGYFTLKSDTNKILYCGCCWGQDHRLIPLLLTGGTRTYQCGRCKTYCMPNDLQKRL